MKFILPTQWSPVAEIMMEGFVIRPNTRVKIENEHMISYWDSVEVETLNEGEGINEWVMFHTFIFNNHISIDWYESFNFGTDKLIPEGECTYLIDYSDISDRIHFPSKCSLGLSYVDLFTIFKASSNEDKALIKNYFNSWGPIVPEPAGRKIRDDSFWRILVLFSIIETLIGDIPKCKERIVCSKHNQVHEHNDLSPKDWIKNRLTEIISDTAVVQQYFDVIWEVRQNIRHKTVHKGAAPESDFIMQNEPEITWDWARVSELWNTDKTAFLGLKTHMSQITRSLLLERVFNIQCFFPLAPLKSVTINSK